MKIVQVLNSMITNHKKISNVIRNGNEYYFIYDKKYKWSINKLDDDDFFIHFYPTNEMTIENLASLEDWGAFVHFVTYTTADMKTKEAEETFRELYQIVADKLYDLDSIFDDIIGSSE